MYIMEEFTPLNLYSERIYPTECILWKIPPPSICISGEYTPLNVYYGRIYPPQSVLGENIPH